MMVISLNYSFCPVNKVRNNVKVIKFHNRNGYNPGHRCDLCTRSSKRIHCQHMYDQTSFTAFNR